MLNLIRLLTIFCRGIFPLPFLIIYSLSQAQSEGTGHLRISLVTCGAGGELYSLWGHTAIRVTDSSAGKDVVFNYGTFDDTDPYFYVKFTRGIMRYALSVDNYNGFLQEYKDDHRTVIEQTLILNGEQKERLFSLLKINALEANRYYNYEFHEDNCTTRAKEVINNSTLNSIIFKNILTGEAPTYRQLIHKNLNNYHQYWNKFAIDILLGSNLDKQATNEGAMFLPYNLMQGFDSATLQQHPVTNKKKVILKGYNTINSALAITPLNLFSALALILIFLSFSKNIYAQKALKIADTIFFSLLGLLGILLIFVWIGRVDSVCRNNLNVLWAWPTHIVIIFLSSRKRTWIKGYFRLSAAIALLIILGWPLLPQQLNIAFIPLLIIIILRGYYIGV